MPNLWADKDGSLVRIETGCTRKARSLLEQQHCSYLVSSDEHRQHTLNRMSDQTFEPKRDSAFHFRLCLIQPI
jgi:hypothetical protein